MKCTEAEEIVKLWEELPPDGGSTERIETFLDHIGSCPACRKRFGALSFFIGRELGPQTQEPEAGFEDAVMRSVLKNPGRKNTRFARFGYPQLAAAALLLVVFAAGFAYRGISTAGAGDTVPVHFTFNAPDARSVVLVGSFPGWSAEDGKTMIRNGLGQWELTVRLEKSGVYTYNFLVDGTEWVPDPSAAEAVDDGFGGLNSLIRL